VVSDHSPCTPDLKNLPSHVPGHVATKKDNVKSLELDESTGNFFAAWGGISSVGLGLPILWSEMSRRGLTTWTTAAGQDALNVKAILDVVKWCSVNTSAQVGLEKNKGELAVGFDGDICIFDETAEWTIRPSTMLFRNKCSPYQGRRMKGQVRETWVRGQQVFVRDGENNGFVGKGKPIGQLLLQPRQREMKRVKSWFRRWIWDAGEE